MNQERSEVGRRSLIWQQSGTTEQRAMLATARGFDQYFSTNPERSLTIAVQCRDEARRLDEPWWEFYFERKRLIALAIGLEDLHRALPVAIECTELFNSPAAQGHESRYPALDLIIHVYATADAVGYRPKIDHAIAELDAVFVRSANEDRFEFHDTWIKYLMALEQWEDAFQLALGSLNQSRQATDPFLRQRYAGYFLWLLCPICQALGRIEELARHAREMPELGLSTQRDWIRAAGWFWSAVAHRSDGDEQAATHALLRGMNVFDTVRPRHRLLCLDAQVAYHEAGCDWSAALGVRNRQLVQVESRGMVHRAALIQIDRCRLLNLLGEVSDAELTRARRMVSHSDDPDWYAARLDQLPARLDNDWAH